jgi:kumamolisin
MARALESSFRQPPLGCVDATADVPWSDGALCDLTLYLQPAGGERVVVDAAEEHVRRRLAGEDAPFLSRAEAAALAGPDSAALDAVVGALRGAGVEHVHPVGMRAVHVQGRWEQLGGLIDVARMRYRTPDGVLVGRAGAINLGDPALDSVVGVFGLDNRRALSSYVIKSHVIKSHVIKSHVIKSHTDPGVIKSHADQTVIKSHVIKSHVIKSHVIKSHGDLGTEMDEAMAEAGREWAVPHEVEDWYDFPPGTGAGTRIAVLAFSGTLGGTDQVVMGGYHVEALTEYWLKELRQTAAPTLQDRVVRGPGNWPSEGDVEGTDFTDEVMLDLSFVGALAPQADVTVWFTEPTEQGFVDALHAVVEEEHAPDLLLVCYGAPEDKGSGTSWTRMATEQADQALALAALRGVTVVVSCGDNGAAGLPLSTRVHADYPSSSAWVLGVGGTTRRPEQAGLDREVVWNDGLAASGGGISAITPRPSWQQSVEIPEPVDAWERPGFRGRGVPDVAAVADLATGVAVLDAAGDTVMGGGTSVAAPVWAALLARVREQVGRPLGFVTPLIYAGGGVGLRDVPMGDNGAYAAKRDGWDPCTGLGVPDGRSVADVLTRDADRL